MAQKCLRKCTAGVSGSVPSDSESAHIDLATALSCQFQMPENKLQLKGILKGSRSSYSM
jgi:hypothetical protein